MSIKIVCKDNRSVAFNKQSINNFSNSELLKDLISSTTDEEIKVDKLNYDQIIIYKDFCEATDYSDFQINDNLLLSKEDNLMLIKKSFPKLEAFIERISSIEKINEYYSISDYLGVKLFDQIIILICLSLINKSETTISMEELKKLREKYISNCEERLATLDKQQIEDIIMT